MSTTAAPTTGGGGSSFFPQNLSHIGLGFSIAVALAFLVLLSSVVLATYVCCRARRNTVNPSSNRNNPSNAIDNAAHPRILFVAEEDNAEEVSSVVGLAQNVINSYPKFDFSRSKDRISPDTVCSICLCDYKDGEMLRMMPDCRHFFHLVCVDSWLRLNASCPICRTSPLPTPLSTPLSELVPLSHYPVTGRRY